MRAVGIFMVTLTCLTSTLGYGAGFNDERNHAVPVIAIAGSDLPGNFNGIEAEGIDISPDNTKAAVVFEAGEGHNTSIWVGIWDLATKKLLSSARIDGPKSAADISDPQFVRIVRFASDGRTLAIQTGPRVCVVDVPSLTQRFSVEPSKIVPSPGNEVIRSFDISQDSKRLAVLTSGIYAPDEDSLVVVRIFDVDTRHQLAEWQTAGRSRHVSLSPDGSRVVIDETGRTRFSVLDSMSGRILREFDSGWQMGVGTAIFVDSDRIATVPEIGTDGKGRFFGNSLKIFSVATGRQAQEIKCGQFGSTASLASATRQPLLVSVNAYVSPREAMSDTAIRKSKPALVLFRLPDGSCQPILKAVPHGQFEKTLDQYSLRISPDGSLVALFEDTVAKVYRLPEALLASR